MTTTRSVLLIGGPDAGKTNFVCRLWLAIKSANGLLRPDGLPDNLDYLEAGVGELLKGEFAPHTPLDVHHQCVIPVRYADGASESRGKLVVPDCSGEQWLGVYRKREWTEDWEELIGEGCGCLLFVRVDSDQIVNPLDWISCTKLFGKPLEAAAPDAGLVAPTQLVLTDWIQCLRSAFTSRVGGNFRPRIGLVVAAWDLVPEEQKNLSPAEYAASNFPLLGQFMEANHDRFRFAVFGLSVVGGDLRNEPGFRQSYLEGDPQTFGYVVHTLEGAVETTSDLTLPVAWAMGIDRAQT